MMGSVRRWGMGAKAAALLVWIASVGFCATEADVARDQGWSANVNGVRARIALERAEVFNGTAMISVRLGLRNEQDVANSLKFPFGKAQLKLQVVDENGNALTGGAVNYDGFMIDSFFDVFTELSIDGGFSWMPSNGPPPPF